MDARREAQQMVIPFASFATPQARFLEATLRDGAIWALSFVTSRLLWKAQLRVLFRGEHPKSPPSQT